MEIFFSLPEWLQGKIKENLNFKGSKLEDAIANYRPDESKEDKKQPAKKKAEPEPTPEPEAEGDGDDTPW